MPPLNRNQLICLWCGLLVIVAMGLIPPWREAIGMRDLLDYSPIYNPPRSTLTSGVTIDFARLTVEWILALIVTGGLIATFGKEDKGRESTSGQIRQFEERSPERQTSHASLADNSRPAQVNVEQPKPAVPMAEKSARAETPPTNSGGPTLNFPAEPIGEVLVESADDPDYWETYAPAAGKVAPPTGKRLQLELQKERAIDVAKLEHLPRDAFFSIDLSGSQVTDSDLAVIGRFVGLRELDLSDTLISDVGIKNLSALSSLQKIWLDNTRVTDKGLADLAKHKELIKISVVGTQINEPEVDALAAAFQQKCDVVLGGDS